MLSCIYFRPENSSVDDIDAGLRDLANELSQTASTEVQVCAFTLMMAVLPVHISLVSFAIFLRNLNRNKKTSGQEAWNH